MNLLGNTIIVVAYPTSHIMQFGHILFTRLETNGKENAMRCFEFIEPIPVSPHCCSLLSRCFLGDAKTSHEAMHQWTQGIFHLPNCTGRSFVLMFSCLQSVIENCFPYQGLIIQTESAKTWIKHNHLCDWIAG